MTHGSCRAVHLPRGRRLLRWAASDRAEDGMAMSTDVRIGHGPVERLSMRLGPIFARGLIHTLRSLMTWSRLRDETVIGLHRQGRPYVHAFYHDQLLMMTYSYLGQRYGRRLAVLSSRHRDGEYVARTLSGFGHIMVRGSTGRGGAGGLREMIRHLRGGNDVAFAVDGPRGPRHQVHPGVIQAARLASAPIIPVVFAASRTIRLRSWDAFQIPMPFSRGVFAYGDPIDVPPGADRTDMEAVRHLLQESLDRLIEEAQVRTRGRPAIVSSGTGVGTAGGAQNARHIGGS